MKFSTAKIYKKLPKALRKRRVILAIIAIAVVLLFLLRGGPDTKQIKIALVEEKSILSEISASGSIKSNTASTLKFATSGKIVWFGVKKGDYVYAGQAIASLDREPFEIALRQAQQDVNAADAILSQVYDEQKKQTQAENFDQKIRRTDAETAKNKTFDAMKKAERDLRNATIYAPQNGTITALNFIAREEVTTTSEIAKINDLADLNFTAQVDETEIAKIQVGQSTQITLDALPNRLVESAVQSIAPASTTTSTGATVFEVTFALPPNQNYRLGLNGEAKIITEKVDNALAVPQDAIIQDKFIYVKKDNRYQKREVEKGLTSDFEVQIISGLKKGEAIVTSGFEEIGKKSLIQKIKDQLIGA